MRMIYDWNMYSLTGFDLWPLEFKLILNVQIYQFTSRLIHTNLEFGTTWQMESWIQILAWMVDHPPQYWLNQLCFQQSETDWNLVGSKVVPISFWSEFTHKGFEREKKLPKSLVRFQSVKVTPRLSPYACVKAPMRSNILTSSTWMFFI